MGLIQDQEHDLVVFAAALVLTKFAKNETPLNAVEFLARVMIHIPETLNNFNDLPLGDNPERSARHVLYNLEPQRLEFLVPAVLNRWQEASKDAFSSLEWAEFLLFVLFQGKFGAEKRRMPFSAAQLTLQQRNVLELLRIVRPGSITIFGSYSGLATLFSRLGGGFNDLSPMRLLVLFFSVE